MRRLLLKLFRRRSLANDLEAELAFHREMAAAQNNTIPLGNTISIKEQALDLWRFNWLENLWRDLVYAARGLRRSPGMVCSALLSLGLGIGVNTAIFSLAVEFLFSEPSVRDASTLVAVGPQGDSHSRPEVAEMVRESGVFQDVAGEHAESNINWNDGEETRRIFSVRATKNYFTTLGVPVAYGRGWTGNDSREVAVLSHQFWTTRFHGDPATLGRPVQLDGRPYTVIGILPAAHRTLTGYGYTPDLYVPLESDRSSMAIYARLKSGMSIGEAGAAMRIVGERLDKEPSHGDQHYARRMNAVAIRGLDRLGEKTKRTIGLFTASLLFLVGLVLLIACVNVAGLLIARASARRQELAVRLALGASRGRLLQQLLAESLLLSFAGAGLGFFLAQLAAQSLAAIRLPLPLPIQLRIEPDWRVVSYAAALAVAATLVCGLLPAMQSLKDSLTSDLRRERRLRLRRALVVIQVAVSFVVLATGALFLQNLLRSATIGVGFDVTRTLRAEVYLPPKSYAEARQFHSYFDRALRELAAIPGIEAAAVARTLPFNGSSQDLTAFTFTDTGETRTAQVRWNAVSPGFFRAMDIPVLAGRPFAEDDAGGPKVVIVNTTFVERVLQGMPPVGASFRWDRGKETYRIVGVVGATKNNSVGEDDSPQLYHAHSQFDRDWSSVQFVLRSSTPPSTQLSAVRAVLRRLEPGAGLEVATMYSSMGLAFLPSQIGAFLMGSVGLLGLLLSSIGLYGVMAYSVIRRTREIGIRVAIGAGRRTISRMILLESAKLVGLGSAIGLAIALIVTKPLAVFLVAGLTPTDPLSFASVVIVLAATGILATLGPVRRALRVDPLTALRYE